MTNLVTLSLQDQIGSILLSSDITESAATAVESALDKAFTYYQYERAVLRINSGGGLLRALQHMLECVRYWRARGRIIETEVTFGAASAAAVLTSFGEIGTRTVYSYSTLLYHHTRVNGTDAAITATGASRLASALESSNQNLMTRMIAHIVHGMGDINNFASQGQIRCELLTSRSKEIADALEFSSEKKIPLWLKTLTKCYGEISDKRGLLIYQRYLTKRMEIDSPMDIREAYALLLIDNVHGVPFMGLLPKTEPRLTRSPAQLAA